MTKITTKIVKNARFETIGIQVSEGQKTLFSWGISPSGLNYVKESFQDNLSEKIFKLVNISAKLDALAHFKSLFFDVLKDSDALVENKGYKMQAIDQEIRNYEIGLKKIIDTIE